MKSMTRRGLLEGAAALGGASIVLGACDVPPPEASDEIIDDGAEHVLDPSPDVEVVEQPAVTPQCGETPDNPLGPFYKAGAPFRNKLASKVQLIVSGAVIGKSGGSCTPLKGAVVDVWHSDQAKPSANYDMSGWKYRGRIRTAANGSYSFQTILPGRYEDPELGFRPRHIHLRVSVGGHRTLVTQLYFKGDPRLGPDPFDEKPLIIGLKKQGSIFRGTFNIVLRKS
jgi:catechol 1,2-dioxygenase